MFMFVNVILKFIRFFMSKTQINKAAINIPLQSI